MCLRTLSEKILVFEIHDGVFDLDPIDDLARGFDPMLRHSGVAMLFRDCVDRDLITRNTGLLNGLVNDGVDEVRDAIRSVHEHVVQLGPFPILIINDDLEDSEVFGRRQEVQVGLANELVADFVCGGEVVDVVLHGFVWLIDYGNILIHLTKIVNIYFYQFDH